jgi:hypothetical protein
MTTTRVYDIQSNGLGQQSIALYLMSSVGVLPRLDYSIFADPGREKKETYEYLKWLKDWQRKNKGVPLICTGKKTLYSDLIKGTNSTSDRVASIPAFTKNPDGSVGQLRRQCTYEYKILEFNRAIRKLLKIPTENFPATRIYMGITIEELDRMEIPEIRKFINVYPFVGYDIDRAGKFQQNQYLEKQYSRADCVKWLVDNGFPVPPKSSCTFCPFFKDSDWLNLKTNEPKEWKAVVKLDYAIRNSSKKGVESPIFLHRSCKPLDKVDFKENQQILFDSDCKGSYCNV